MSHINEACLRLEITDLRTRILNLERERDELAKVVGKLPKDKNGNRLAPEMLVRLPCGHKTEPVRIVSERHFCILGECCHDPGDGSRTGKWYSDNQCTVEAALAQSGKAAEEAKGATP